MNTQNHGDDFVAKRSRQLRKLTREHQDCLLFADNLAEIAKHGDDEALASGVEMVRAYNDAELEAHLQHEEQTIFAPLIQEYGEHMDLCIALGKEHGYLRTLVEEMTPETARKHLADFARVLRSHTLVEEEKLFPLVDSLFTQAQLDAVMAFTPFRRQAPSADRAASLADAGGADAHRWLDLVERHQDGQDPHAGSVVLFPRYRPDLSTRLADRLGLAFFDFREQVMEALGTDAEHISLEQLSMALRDRAGEGGIVVHNIEALLCVKSEADRSAWLRAFLDQDWPHPVIVPISVYQSDVPEEHPRVCDLELLKMPRSSGVEEAPRENIGKYRLDSLG